MPPPCGDGACWYWPAKIVFAEDAAEAGRAFRAACVPDVTPHPLCGQSTVVPNTVSTRCHSSASTIAGSDTTSQSSCQHMAGQMVPRVTPEGWVSPIAECRNQPFPCHGSHRFQRERRRAERAFVGVELHQVGDARLRAGHIGRKLTRDPAPERLHFRSIGKLRIIGYSPISARVFMYPYFAMGPLRSPGGQARRRQLPQPWPKPLSRRHVLCAKCWPHGANLTRRAE